MSDTTRPDEVQHIIDFIENGGVTQYSQQQMLAMTEYIEALEGERARADRLAKCERLLQAIQALVDEQTDDLGMVVAAMTIRGMLGSELPKLGIAEARKALDGDGGAS